MHTLLNRKHPIPTLYVKAAPMTYNIQQVFAQARNLSPCMLILEDIETIVTPQTRSYFFNEMDGIEDNSGLFVVGSTNYLDRLDPGLTSRPSRFDRKYLFPLPNQHERTLYCQFWRRKLEHNKAIKFPEELCVPMARITDGFSFAFLQEAFVGSMLFLAHQTDQVKENVEDEEELEKYELWRVFKKQVVILRKEIKNQNQYETPGRRIPPRRAELLEHDDMRAPVGIASCDGRPLEKVGRPFRELDMTSFAGGVTGTALIPSHEGPQGQEFLGASSRLTLQDENKESGVARLNTNKVQVINSRAFALQ